MIVVPSTAPSSYAVSDTALAAPAFAGGALARMSSFDTVSAAPMPMPSDTNATISSGSEPLLGGRPRRARYPTTENASAAGTTTRGATRLAIGTTPMPATIIIGEARARARARPRIGRQPDDQLQVLRDEVEEADERRSTLSRLTSTEPVKRPAAEQRHVEHRRLEPVLPAHEQHAEHEPGDDEHERRRALERRAPRTP